MMINLLVDLVSGQLDSLGVDHDDVIAAIEKRRVIRLVFADQHLAHARRQATQHLPVRVNHEPILAYR